MEVLLMIFNLLLLVILITLPIHSTAPTPPCPKEHHKLLSLAFHSVSGFNLPQYCPNSPLRELRLPSSNLTGTVSWLSLRKISTLLVVDLSDNLLIGTIPASFWASSSLTEVNLAGNHLGGTLRFDSLTENSALRVLNVSRNRFTKVAGLPRLSGLKVLDLSLNSINGYFPIDFPPLNGLRFLNLSFNNLSGWVGSKALAKFGISAFKEAGSDLITFSPPPPLPPPPPPHNNNNNNKQRSLKTYKLVAISAASVVVLLLGLLTILCLVIRMVKRRRRKGDHELVMENIITTAGAGEQEATWVAEAKWSAPVVIFEKPLMELTFAELATATSGFGKDSQLAEGRRCGPLYRAVLAGDMHVVIRVVESARDADELRELARLRHPNLLPLLGYCLAGKEKLLLYEYIERGDVPRWLHELPAGRPGEEEDTRESSDWPARHRVALGVARGLAFLHQGWAGSGRPVVHGHLVPENVLLDDELEARIADFGVVNGGDEGSAPEDVHSFGLLVWELVTGRGGWSEVEVERMRAAVRGGTAAEVVDPKLKMSDGSPEWEKEMVECIRVGYLCTARCQEKRPTMHQVVGLLKDIRPIINMAASSAANPGSSLGSSG
ncbi:hypothetical protein J5N97_026027 [Dioscorea zingiberensis]|uniref:Protein kinase domain-containing protein n=1 Tax=Dioscorea zingiberensis TaxID=325984 RepID=A0A9D5C1Z3_9LILI|nr:hypothetical protein J5N97_026027 [Dioscorea zingiberensis]